MQSSISICSFVKISVSFLKTSKAFCNLTKFNFANLNLVTGSSLANKSGLEKQMNLPKYLPL